MLLDLALGIERAFVEKHPTSISAMAFFEDKVLISGSIDGKVNLCDIEGEECNTVYKCQNTQDRRIPIASVVVSEFGVGIVVDIDGNCRFYDLHRLNKIAKVSSRAPNVKAATTWRMVPNPTFVATNETFIAVVNEPASEEHTVPDTELPPAPDVPVKLAKGQEPPPPVDPPKPYEVHSEKDIVIASQFSHQKENMKSLRNIVRGAPEKLFVMQKSHVLFFRLEDIILNLFPHLAAYRKRGVTTKDVFENHDPLNRKETQSTSPDITSTNIRLTEAIGSPVQLNDTAKSGFSKKLLSNFLEFNNDTGFNFAIGGGAVSKAESSRSDKNSSGGYGAPTLAMLNPELFKQM